MSDLSPLARKIVHWLRFLAIHNLGMLLAGLAVLGFIANMWMPVPVDRFVLVPDLVLEGQWWRLFTFAFTSGMTHPIWLLFYCLYIIFLCNALEQTMGAAALTVYVLLGYLALIGVSFITYVPLDLSFFLVEFLTLAFATLYPEYELHLYGIVPVKAKWFGVLAAALIGWQFILGSWISKLTLPLAFLPYLVFFYPRIRWVVRNLFRK